MLLMIINQYTIGYFFPKVAGIILISGVILTMLFVLIFGLRPYGPDIKNR